MKSLCCEYVNKLSKQVWEGMILHGLSLKDLIRFGAVSRSWRSLAAENQHYLHGLPWLLISRDKDKQTGTFFSLTEAKTYTLKLTAEASDSFCSGSNKGYLILADKDSNFLYNPFSQTKIRLPRQYVPPKDAHFTVSTRDHRCYFTKATLCCTNSLNMSSQQYAIAALGSNPQVIEICRPYDSQWLVFGADKDQESYCYDHEEAIMAGEHEHWLFVDLMFYKGMLYGLTRAHGLVTFELWDSSKPLAYRVLNMLPLHIPDEDADEIASYLVESCGELLMVFRLRQYVDNGYEDEFSTIKLLVFSLDQSSDLLQWVRVQSLGGQMLFLGRNYSLSVSATGTPGFKGNCIYFTDNVWPYFWSGNNSQASCLDNGIFYLDDGRIETFYTPDDSCQFKSQPIWITPNSIFSID